MAVQAEAVPAREGAVRVLQANVVEEVAQAINFRNHTHKR